MNIKIQLKEGGHLPTKSEKGDWYDLYANEQRCYKQGEIICIPLGVSMQLPDGYCAMIVPRSGLLIHSGFYMQTGVIDNAYCVPQDEWCAIGFGVQDGKIRYGERIAQFRLFKNEELIQFEEATLTGENRGGFGSTGQ